ncbi:MAG: hypothetical protein PHS54_05460 [Clostridia bacterium]|nr:hypothetical protein [Clostridia bacterium]
MNDITLVILSCDNFIDVLDGCIKSIHTFWSDCPMPIAVITESIPEKRFDNVTFFDAGKGKEYSDRIKISLPQIKTKYVMVMLGDYYINKKVDTKRIEYLYTVIRNNDIDYLRLFNKSFKEKKKFPEDKSLRIIDTSYFRYKVNLYIGIWKKDTLLKMCQESQNAWQFEVSLTEKMHHLHGKCLTITKKEISIADVVRKGKITRNTWKYVHKNGLYEGDRVKQDFKSYFRLKMISFLKTITPVKIQEKIKKRLIKKGHKYYSSWDKDKNE